MKVLFIAGAGRSGSTIVERVLGSCQGVFAMGELRHIWLRGIIENALCACGVPFDACPFWSHVMRMAFNTSQREVAARAFALVRATMRLRQTPLHWLNPKPPTFSAHIAEYASFLEPLLRSVAEVAQCDILVDSSKRLHGYALSTVTACDCHVIHIVRDSRAVAHSWSRRKRYEPVDAGHARLLRNRGPAASAAMWTADNVAAEGYRAHAAGYTRLRYESFAAQPGTMIRTILDAVDEPTISLPFEHGNTIKVTANHSVSGNPIRFATGALQVSEDDEWKTAMDPRRKALVTALTFPLLARYSYL